MKEDELKRLEDVADGLLRYVQDEDGDLACLARGFLQMRGRQAGTSADGQPLYADAVTGRCDLTVLLDGEEVDGVIRADVEGGWIEQYEVVGPSRRVVLLNGEPMTRRRFGTVELRLPA